MNENCNHNNIATHNNIRVCTNCGIVIEEKLQFGTSDLHKPCIKLTSPNNEIKSNNVMYFRNDLEKMKIHEIKKKMKELSIADKRGLKKKDLIQRILNNDVREKKSVIIKRAKKVGVKNIGSMSKNEIKTAIEEKRKDRISRYDKMYTKDIRRIAKSKGIKYFCKFKRDDLIKNIEKMRISEENDDEKKIRYIVRLIRIKYLHTQYDMAGLIDKIQDVEIENDIVDEIKKLTIDDDLINDDLINDDLINDDLIDNDLLKKMEKLSINDDVIEKINNVDIPKYIYEKVVAVVTKDRSIYIE